MSPLAPYKSTTAGSADAANFVVPAGTYVVHTDTGLSSSEYSTSTPNPTATAGGTGMTLQVTVDGSNNVTAVQILNPGKDYKFHNTLRIPGDHFTSAGTGFVELALNPTSTTGLSANTPITSAGGMFSGNPGGAQLSSVAALDVLTVANAKKMLTAVDGALVRVDLERSDLGATMSRMEHVINNLSNIVKNTQEARSRIQDADIALETTNLTKAQVLNQAAQAMLAQANRTSQSIMSLLQN
jgi:flagellin